MSINNLSDHVLAIASQNDRISNMQLHKIMFFAIGLGFKEELPEMEALKNEFDNVFERWRYGPVVPELYYKYNHYGYREIKDDGEYQEKYSFLNELINDLLRVDVYKMVSISHQMRAWNSYEGSILNKEYVPKYSFREIKRDFLNA